VKQGQGLCRCRLEGSQRVKPLEVAQWMLDRATCRGMRLVSEPQVACGDLLRLKELLRSAAGDGDRIVRENQHRSLIGKGDADEKTPLLPSHGSTGIVSPAPENADLAEPTSRSQAAGHKAPRAHAAGASRRASCMEGKGGAR